VIARKFGLLRDVMDERTTRLWAGTEADSIGYGGVAAVARATGLAMSTVRKEPASRSLRCGRRALLPNQEVESADIGGVAASAMGSRPEGAWRLDRSR
jgi:hypothetical protein